MLVIVLRYLQMSLVSMPGSMSRSNSPIGKTLLENLYLASSSSQILRENLSLCLGQIQTLVQEVVFRNSLYVVFFLVEDIYV